MAFEKRYTAKQTAHAVLEKVGELLKKATLTDDLNKSEKMEKAKVDNHLGLSPEDKKIARGFRKLSGRPTQGTGKLPMPNPMAQQMGKGEGYKPENDPKENAKPSEHNSKDAYQNAEGKGPKGEIHPKEHAEGGTDGKSAEVRTQTSPEKNPKEKAEGNNELAGTTPTQVGQDGKNVPGGDEISGHLKLAKFIGRMEHKRTTKKAMP
jgi:hypothetical protein